MSWKSWLQQPRPPRRPRRDFDAATNSIRGGGGRGIYSQVDGDFPVALSSARTSVPARAVAHWCHSVPPDRRSVLAEAAPASSIQPDTCIMHVNIQGLLSHLAELTAYIRMCTASPDIVCINETFLDVSVEEVDLEGFVVVGRRDRGYNGDERRCGGVIVFARCAIADHVTLLEKSDNAERMWFQLHSDVGPFLMSTWYRPPASGEVGTIESFEEEYSRLRGHALGTLLVGDLNLHCPRWLKHSSHNSKEGELMRNVCLKTGLRQIVRGPTRGENLLDLLMTDIESASVRVASKIADHAILLAHLNLSIPQTVVQKRKVWMYTKANWEELKRELLHIDCSFLADRGASEGAVKLTTSILECVERQIPSKMICTRKKSHPWLTEDIMQLVVKKHAARGTAEYDFAVKACSDQILAGYHEFASGARKKLLEARRGSKQWWTLSRELLMQRTKIESIPALKADDGSWVHNPAGKAELLAGTFNGKNVLPELVENEYTELQRNRTSQRIKGNWTESDVCKVLLALDESSGTGPDLLPSKILKYCAQELAVPVLQLALQILEAGEWPDTWREHWMVPIYKRSAVFKPQNYRGVHLTAQLSKVVERLVLMQLEPHITRCGLSGTNQFAYTKKRGARDVLALLALRWVMALDKGFKLAVYCSDVSGAFDKVSRKRLLTKLAAKGIDSKLLKLIGSWLEPRTATVVVGGSKSNSFRIQDMVYQGTVLGPQLWNLYFEDAAKAIQEFFFEEIVYADDLNAFRIFPSTMTNDKIMKTIGNVQEELHSWGAANQVTFDAKKESKHILSRTDPEGSDFKLLGVVFDPELQMTSAVHTLVGKVKWKVKMLLRSRRFFGTVDLVLQYKQQVLSFIEYRTPAIYHATATVLKQLDRTQDGFLRELGIDSAAALMEFNLAPLSMRRDIALLGMIHRAAIGDGPPQLREIFRRRPGSMRMEDPLADQNPSRLLRRSIWGLVRVYNNLGATLECATVPDFQRHLQDRAKRVVEKRLTEDWATLYCPR